MSKPAQWQTRASASIKGRHMTKARELATRLQEHAAFILRDLDAGRIPHYSLVADAVELARRVEALEALRELSEVYEAGGED